MNPNSPKLCLFIPCYNVDHAILNVLNDIPDECLNKIGKVFIIDNGSNDATAQKALRWIHERNDPRFELYQNEQNYSLGGSTIIALSKAIHEGYDFLVCMHGDGQAKGKDLARIIEESQNDVDLVLGSRLMRESRTSEYSKLRLWANQGFAWLQSKLIGRKLGDIGSFISFNLRWVRPLAFDRLPHDMGYQPLLILIALKQNPQLKIKEIPIYWGAAERSNVRVFRYAVTHAWRLLKIATGVPMRSGRTTESFKTNRVYT